MSETCRALLQNKCEKSVHLAGFIIRIYRDARSPERQIQTEELSFDSRLGQRVNFLQDIQRL